MSCVLSVRVLHVFFGHFQDLRVSSVKLTETNALLSLVT